MITLIRPCWQKHPKIWTYRPSILGLLCKRLKHEVGRSSHRRTLYEWHSIQVTQLSNPPWWMGARERLCSVPACLPSLLQLFSIFSRSLPVWWTRACSPWWAGTEPQYFEHHLQFNFFNFIQVNRFGEDSMRYRSPIWSS